ncbi:MAG: hypothetical protein LUH18_05165 [Oscillospiraceae bacterium]|nr:hypothetical protein [Oscillospiraceae bacterium]
MDKFIVNIIHRPELSPEYAEKVTGRGKKENVGADDLHDESLDIFIFQQETAHANGLKTTIQITYASLFNDIIVDMAKHDHEVYGDEIALSLLGLPCKQFKEKYKTKDFCIWMFSEEDKMAIIDDCFSLFYEKFGFYPQSTGSYYLDAFCINYIKEKYPSVTCAVATCWEEGPKAYHTCNNSWYTFMDGGPWAPWIPSKHNTHCPAMNEADDSGIVAIPHLSRDLIACFDGNGSNFGTHPQNVLRGLVYKDNELPYFFNLVDQYRHLGKYNNGLAYNMVFVGPGWLNKAGRWEAPYELLKKSYEDGMAYYGKLKKEGKCDDMTMSEFADYYRSVKSYDEPEVALWKDILYGSQKQYFWYCDSYMRACLDFNQGGAMIDLRPYVAQLDWKCGIGTDHVYDASYPYLIQANYRAGYFTHYAGAGTVKSLKVSCGSEEIDLALVRCKASWSKEGEDTVITTTPVEIKFSDFTMELQSKFTFKRGTGEIIIERNILNDIGNHEVTFDEYFTGAFGTTEYQSDMTKVKLICESESECETVDFNYKCRIVDVPSATSVRVVIPDVETIVEMTGDNDFGEFEEGHAFSPSYRLSLKKKLNKGGMRTCLKLQKAD